jgi:hypothetical protein
MGWASGSSEGCYRGKTNATKSDLLSMPATVHGKELAPMDKAQAEAIASKHAALHAMIDEEEHRPHPNEDLLHQLKKEKLRLKDELAGHYEH